MERNIKLNNKTITDLIGSVIGSESKPGTSGKYSIFFRFDDGEKTLLLDDINNENDFNIYLTVKGPEGRSGIDFVCKKTGKRFSIFTEKK